MGKNGKLFVSIISRDDFIPSIWDPYVYRGNGESHTLSRYVTIKKVGAFSVPPERIPFEPIEYRDIPKGYYLSFAIRPRNMSSSDEISVCLPIVGENELLFGTMRAYLGNALVTPMAEWVNEKSPIYFRVKSEFVIVSPHDQATYFWLAYMRSRTFLENLPIGSGGTRPRLQIKLLGEVPVTVPPLSKRRDIHERLRELARVEWSTHWQVVSSLGIIEAGA